MSQEKEILKALQSGQKLTPMDALSFFNCFRLGARIYDLRRLGYSIKSTLIKVSPNSWVSEYSIDPPEKQTISPLTKTS